MNSVFNYFFFSLFFVCNDYCCEERKQNVSSEVVIFVIYKMENINVELTFLFSISF